jgi:hypothetical protein
MLTTKMRLSSSGSVPLIVSCGIRQETRGLRVQRDLRIRNSENRPEILVPDLNNNLVTIAGYKPGPPFCQALRNLESLGFRSRHVGQLNPTWIFVRSEVKQRTQIINALRGHLAEFGIVVAKGPAHVPHLVQAVEDGAEPIPELARPILQMLVEALHRLDEQLTYLDREVAERAKRDETARRLMTIPGVGPVTAVAVAALAPPAETFTRGRDFAAWVGLTPLQHSTGGKQKLGATSKMGERTLRRLLILGASGVLRWAARNGAPAGSWLARMLARKPPMLVRVALANKMARVIWALMAKGGIYRAPAASV